MHNMKITVLSFLIFLTYNLNAQLEGFKPIIRTICDTMYQINQSPETSSEIDYIGLVRNSKNKHIDNWGAELNNYLIKYSGNSSFVFDKYFYHQLLRYCPEYLNNQYSNLFFYVVDSTNRFRYNQLRKLVIDMELSDSLDTDDYSVLNALPKPELDSIKNIASPFLKSIAENCYLETQLQINKEKVTYIRFTYHNYMTRDRLYELHFYYNSDSNLFIDHIVFRSKEELQLEAEKRRKLMEIPPPPPAIKSGN